MLVLLLAHAHSTKQNHASILFHVPGKGHRKWKCQCHHHELFLLCCPFSFAVHACYDARGAYASSRCVHACRQLLKNRQQPYFLPCTALGVMELIARSGITLPGKTAVVIGDSSVVGTPLAMLLQANGVAALTVCPRSSYPEAFESQARANAGACLPHQPKTAGHHQTKDVSQQLANGQAPHSIASTLSAEQRQQPSQQIQTNLDVSDPPAAYSAAMRDLPSIAQTADILIVAVGHAELVKRSWIKPGAVVIDVGINVVGNIDTGAYHVVGDIAYAEVAQVASAITPVPGGVGPMTIAAVLHNTIQAARSNSCT